MSDDASFEPELRVSGGTIRFAFGTAGERDHIAGLVRAHGLAQYEPPTPVVLAELARTAPGLVLDIGANTGVFTLLAAAASAEVRVVGFEPLEDARQMLVANIARNPALSPRIVVAPVALSSARAAMPFFETINDHGLISTSSSLEARHADRVGPHVRREIATDTLDAWWRESGKGPVRLVKIDVEGHEHEVLAGGRLTIARDRPIIVVEILGAAEFDALDAMLAQSQYRDFAMLPAGLHARPRVRFHAEAWNHLLCPAEKTGVVAEACARSGVAFLP